MVPAVLPLTVVVDAHLSAFVATKAALERSILFERLSRDTTQHSLG